jgi:glyoxylase-like metal-dependent hydrolase (beta-lactamase superfamily II)
MRRIAKLLSVWALASMAQAQPGPPGPLPKLVKVKDDLYLIQNVTADLAGIQAFGGNIAVYLTNDGVILVDTKNDRMHEDVVAKVKSLTDKPIKYVILTHNHADHASGAAQMAAIGATVIISASDLENLARAPNAAWVPQFGYVGQAELMLGGKEVRLREVRGHTRGDTLVYFPAARVACGGDLFTSSDQLPLIVSYADGGNWMDLSNAIDELLKFDFEVVIPGHGSPVTRQEVVAIRNRVVAIRERFRALVRERKTQEEISATLVKEFNWGTGPAAGNIPGMMQELR